MKITRSTLKDCVQMHRISSAPGLSNPAGQAPPLFWYESFVREKQYSYVIKEGRNVAGFVFGERTCGDIGLIWMLGVDRKYRKRGFATSLMKHAEEQMKADGLHVIIAYGFAKNPVVQRLLEKLGYHPGNSYVEHVRFLE
ncbi:MAG: GNAT family N-acetyltransferase [Victivallales bacterium]